MVNRQPELRFWRCPRCGYDLSATQDADGAHCPECGSAFSDAQLRQALQRREFRSAIPKLGVLWLPLPAALLGATLDYAAARALNWWPTGLATLGAVITTAYALSVISLLRSDDAPLPWLTAVPMMLVVLMLNAALAVFLAIAIAIISSWIGSL